MASNTLYALISTIIVSIVSLVGIFLFQLKIQSVKVYNILVSFAIGTIAGSAFLHFIPQAFNGVLSKKIILLLVLSGVFLFWIFEKTIHFFQSDKNKKDKVSYGYLSLYADAAHNFMDGILIGVAWLYSPEAGLTTTFSILFHELPQELSDFGILIKAGFSKKKALKYNFLVSLTAILGTVLVILLGNITNNFSQYILPFMAGAFIYLTFSILFTEIRKQRKVRLNKSILIYSFFLLLGLGMMYITSITHQH